MSVSLTYKFELTGVETVSNLDGVTTATVYRDAYNVSGSATYSMVYEELIALTAGAYTINLASVPGVNGVAQDGTGKRIQKMRVTNLGANAMTFSEGASNGIALSCLPFTVPAGGSVQWDLNDASPDIASGDRTIDIAGTGTQTCQVTIYID